MDTKSQSAILFPKLYEGLIDTVHEALEAMQVSAHAYLMCTKSVQLDERCAKKALSVGLPLEQLAQEHWKNPKLMLYWARKYGANDEYALETMYQLSDKKIIKELVEELMRLKVGVTVKVLKSVQEDEQLLLKVMVYDPRLAQYIPDKYKKQSAFAWKYAQMLTNKIKGSRLNADKMQEYWDALMGVGWSKEVLEDPQFKQTFTVLVDKATQKPYSILGCYGSLYSFLDDEQWVDSTLKQYVVEHKKWVDHVNKQAHASKKPIASVAKSTGVKTDSKSLQEWTSESSEEFFKVFNGLGPLLNIAPTVVMLSAYLYEHSGAIPVEPYVLAQCAQNEKCQSDPWLQKWVKEHVKGPLGVLSTVDQIQAALAQMRLEKSTQAPVAEHYVRIKQYDQIIKMIDQKVLWSASVTEWLLKEFGRYHFINMPKAQRSHMPWIKMAFEHTDPYEQEDIYHHLPIKVFEDAQMMQIVKQDTQWVEHVYGIEWMREDQIQALMNEWLGEKSSKNSGVDSKMPNKVSWDRVFLRLGERVTNNIEWCESLLDLSIQYLMYMPDALVGKVQYQERLLRRVHWMMPDVLDRVARNDQKAVAQLLMQSQSNLVCRLNSSVGTQAPVLESLKENLNISFLTVGEMLNIVKDSDLLKGQLIEAVFKGVPEFKSKQGKKVHWNFKCLDQYIKGPQVIDQMCAHLEKEHLDKVVAQHAENLGALAVQGQRQKKKLKGL